MTWMFWLLAPLSVIVVTALLTWLANRPPKPITADQAISAHRRFLIDLADLTETSASAVRPAPDVNTATQRGHLSAE